jgi:hypothetical protein
MTMEGGHQGPYFSEKCIWCDDTHRFEIYFDEGKVISLHKRAGYEQFPGPYDSRE